MNVFDEYTVATGVVDAARAEGTPATNLESLAVSAVEDDSAPRELFNGRKPLYTLKAEKPEHRAIIMMKASAMTHKEIAAATGLTAQAVMYIVKQPWAQEQILREIEQAGREPVIQLLKVSAMDAAQRLITIAESSENDETRRKANNDILDRVFGKANQSLTVENKTDAAKLSEQEIDKRLAELYAKRSS